MFRSIFILHTVHNVNQIDSSLKSLNQLCVAGKFCVLFIALGWSVLLSCVVFFYCYDVILLKGLLLICDDGVC
jgi:hypothetical protein